MLLSDYTCCLASLDRHSLSTLAICAFFPSEPIWRTDRLDRRDSQEKGNRSTTIFVLRTTTHKTCFTIHSRSSSSSSFPGFPFVSLCKCMINIRYTYILLPSTDHRRAAAATTLVCREHSTAGERRTVRTNMYIQQCTYQSVHTQPILLP